MEADNKVIGDMSLKNMLVIVAMYMILHNLCILNNECIIEGQIVKAENKLVTSVIEEGLRKGIESQGEKAGIAEVKRIVLARDDVPIPDEVNDVETNLFL